MTTFRDTNEAAEFIATANGRETSIEVMRAIAFFARSTAEAEALWEGAGIGTVAHVSDVWEHATKNGLIDGGDLFWGGRTLTQVLVEDSAA